MNSHAQVGSGRETRSTPPFWFVTVRTRVQSRAIRPRAPPPRLCHNEIADSESIPRRSMDRSTILNFNVGVLGHIDSGKTSLGASACNIYSMHETVGDTGRSYDRVHYLES